MGRAGDRQCVDAIMQNGCWMSARRLAMAKRSIILVLNEVYSLDDDSD